MTEPHREPEPRPSATARSAEAFVRATLRPTEPLPARFGALLAIAGESIAADRASLWIEHADGLECAHCTTAPVRAAARVAVDAAWSGELDQHRSFVRLDGARHPLRLTLGGPAAGLVLESPVFGADRRIGLVLFERDDRTRPFDLRARDLAATCADRFAVLIEHKLARDRRSEDAARLHDAQRMQALGRLTSGVAHDFNNALTAILGGLQLLADGVPTDSELAEFAERTLEAVGFATDLTRQLLDFSRGDRLAPDAMSIDAVVRRIDRLLRALLGDRRPLELTLDADGVVVAASPTRIAQVVLNLVANARDAIVDSGAVEIATWLDAGRVYLRVTDDGSGIPDDVRARIFEPLFTTKPRGEGSGLGLATVRHVVEELGGTIEVDSTPGIGTSFTIGLPDAGS